MLPGPSRPGPARRKPETGPRCPSDSPDVRRKRGPAAGGFSAGDRAGPAEVRAKPGVFQLRPRSCAKEEEWAARWSGDLGKGQLASRRLAVAMMDRQILKVVTEACPGPGLESSTVS